MNYYIIVLLNIIILEIRTIFIQTNIIKNNLNLLKINSIFRIKFFLILMK